MGGRLLGCVGAWACGGLGAWVPGCAGVRVLGRAGVKVLVSDPSVVVRRTASGVAVAVGTTDTDPVSGVFLVALVSVVVGTRHGYRSRPRGSFGRHSLSVSGVRIALGC